jgi:RNA polymerase sigma factor (TIGR02999 family)
VYMRGSGEIGAKLTSVGVESFTVPDVTELLNAWSQGDPGALDRLIPLVYGELRKLAHHYLRAERSGATLQSTALVHEAYLRLVKQEPVDWQSRSHFFGVASRLIRQILVDQARKRNAARRGSGDLRLVWELSDGSPAGEVDLLLLDNALTGLAHLDERQSRIVELRFFGGLSVEETAVALGISERTVKREWASAKAWLFQQLAGEGEGLK